MRIHQDRLDPAIIRGSRCRAEMKDRLGEGVGWGGIYEASSLSQDVSVNNSRCRQSGAVERIGRADAGGTRP